MTINCFNIIWKNKTKSFHRLLTPSLLVHRSANNILKLKKKKFMSPLIKPKTFLPLWDCSLYIKDVCKIPYEDTIIYFTKFCKTLNGTQIFHIWCWNGIGKLSAHLAFHLSFGIGECPLTNILEPFFFFFAHDPKVHISIHNMADKTRWPSFEVSSSQPALHDSESLLLQIILNSDMQCN